MKYENKTIMILGAGQLQVPILQRAKEKGLRVIVVSPSLDQPGIQYADAIVPLDVRDQDGILNAAIDFCIDGITTDQTDLPVRTAAYVAEKMGLNGIGYECGTLFTDKYLQREKCREIGVDTVAYRLTHNIEEAELFSEEIGYPLIIKPVDSQASHGVSKISNIQDLKRWYPDAVKYSRDGKVLVEEFINGLEFPVDSYVINGKCNLLAIGQYNPFSIADVFSSYETIWPANQPKEVLDLIAQTNKRIVEGFGLPFGRTHGEYIVSNGKCYLVEIGARGGGSFFSSDDVRMVSGISSEDFLIDAALGYIEEPIVEQSRRCNCCCTLFFYLPENGEIINTAEMDNVLNLKYVGRNNLYLIHKGDHTVAITDKGARYFMVVEANSYAELDARVNTIRDQLRIITRLSNGQEKLPIWF